MGLGRQWIARTAGYYDNTCKPMKQSIPYRLPLLRPMSTIKASSERISVLRTDPIDPIPFPLTQDLAAFCVTRRAPIVLLWLTTGLCADSISACASAFLR